MTDRPVLEALETTRRSVLLGTGALVMAFSMRPAEAQTPPKLGDETQNFAPQTQPTPDLPGSLKTTPNLESWLKVDASGKATIFTGKAELGQGIRTALMQVAAEELKVPFENIILVTPDTGITPNEGFTAGSHSITDSGAAIRNAAAQARELLIGEAAKRFSLPAEQLQAKAGQVTAPDGRKLGYGDLVSAELIKGQAQPKSKLTPPSEFTEMGKPRQRVDIPAKVTGGEAYIQDMRPADLVHGRIVRPPSPGAKLKSLDPASVLAMPGVLKVVRDGNFIGVIAEKEWTAIKAMRTLSALAQWDEKASLPNVAKLPEVLVKMPVDDGVVASDQKPVNAARTFSATFTRPYQIHGSIGPSCGLAKLENGVTTVWTHTQGVFPDQKAIAQMLNVPLDKVRCIHVEGSGCYGHNAADDAGADAAFLAQSMPGKTVRVQWMREQEHSWEPFSPNMVTKVRAGLDTAGNIVDWNYELWSNSHNSRPGTAGSLLVAQHIAKAFPPDVQKLAITPEGNGDRNANPLYAFPSRNVIWHFVKDTPIRVSALRGLGAYMNVLSIECFMDELATAAGADPVEYRLRHMKDPRARDVIALAAKNFGWKPDQKAPEGHGYGFAFARYKNLAAYCAVAMEVKVEMETGRVELIRASSAVDAGEVVNPNGVINQVQGGIIQASSWTLYEGATFDDTRITSVDWSTYPIMRFDAVPTKVDVEIIPRPGTPFLGAGECGQGPGGASVANAVAKVIGRRLYDLPMSRDKIKTTIRA